MESSNHEADAPAFGDGAAIPQDLALILDSGVLNTATAAPHATSDSSKPVEEPAPEPQEKSLAEYRAAVAAARAQLEASRIRRAAEASAEVKAASADIAANDAETASAAGDFAANDVKDTRPLEGGDIQEASSEGDGSPEIVEQLTASAAFPSRKRRRLTSGAASASAAHQSGSDAESGPEAQSKSSDAEDSDSSSHSDSESDDSSSDDDDSDGDTDEAQTKQPRKRKGKGAAVKRVERLPAWANTASDEDDDGDEPDGAMGPTTKNEVSLAALTLNQPSVQVIPASERIHYLGRVSSIIGAVVVVEQDVRGSAGLRDSRPGGRGPKMTGGADDLGHDVLDSGSLLLFSNRKVLGTIFETFGSVLQPMYTLRFPSPADIPSLDLSPAKKEEENAPDDGKLATAASAAEEDDDDDEIDGAPLDLDAAGGEGALSADAQPIEAQTSTEPIAEAPQPAEGDTVQEGTVKVESPPATIIADHKSKPEAEETQPPKPATPLTVGTQIFYAPTHSNFVFTSQLRKLKGSDASNLYDEEVAEDELEYSDDEAEAEARRRKKGAKKRERAGQGDGDSIAGADSSVRDRGSARGRGRGQDRGRGRGSGPTRGRGGAEGRGRGRGGGGYQTHAGMRHRDDLGGSDSMMGMSVASSGLIPGGSLPASLPARPTFSYDFDNNGGPAAAVASASTSVLPPLTVSPSSGRRTMPAPYDEPAGAVHTLSLPAKPSVQPAAAQPTEDARQASSRWDQRNSAPSGESAVPGGSQQQGDGPEGSQSSRLAADGGSTEHIAPHINPLFAQQWQQQQQGSFYQPYGAANANYGQHSLPAASHQTTHQQQQQQYGQGQQYGGAWNPYYGGQGGFGYQGGGPPGGMGAYPQQGYTSGPPTASNAAYGQQGQQQAQGGAGAGDGGNQGGAYGQMYYPAHQPYQ
ncbi:hypothetical protein V8E36_004766 [Tilletia maclaganii]